MDSLLNKAVVQHAIKARNIFYHLRKPRPLTRTQIYKVEEWGRGGSEVNSEFAVQYQVGTES